MPYQMASFESKRSQGGGVCRSGLAGALIFQDLDLESATGGFARGEAEGDPASRGEEASVPRTPSLLENQTPRT